MIVPVPLAPPGPADTEALAEQPRLLVAVLLDSMFEQISGTSPLMKDSTFSGVERSAFSIWIVMRHLFMVCLSVCCCF